MSRLQEYRRAEEELRRQLEQLEKMKNDGALAKEIEFESKLRALMEEYGISEKSLIALIAPSAPEPATRNAATGTRRPREMKVYKNPNSGETIQTKGGNHKQLKEWKAEYGAEVVESWRQP